MARETKHGRLDLTDVEISVVRRASGLCELRSVAEFARRAAVAEACRVLRAHGLAVPPAVADTEAPGGADGRGGKEG